VTKRMLGSRVAVAKCRMSAVLEGIKVTDDTTMRRLMPNKCGLKI
jgi:hypothetical protein